MSKYDVYGMGNALVDKEFEVEDGFFSESDIEKGFMTLVDHDQQDQLLAHLTDRYGIRNRSGGGSAANTLYALSQFGGSAYLSCKIANDETGDFFMQQLGHHNIESNSDNQRVEGVTGRCIVMISPDAERTMHTYLGVSADVSWADVHTDAVLQSKSIYLEGYLVTSDGARDAICRLKQFAEQNGVSTSMTFSDPSMVEYFPDQVNEVLGSGVDLLFCNEQEAQIWSGEDDFAGACEALKSRAKTFVITRGSRGALLFDGQRYIEVDSHPVKAVDTNGAGDMFAGAFRYGINHGMDFASAGALASKASATVVSNFGPRLKPEEHEEILKTLNKPSS